MKYIKSHVKKAIRNAQSIHLYTRDGGTTEIEVVN